VYNEQYPISANIEKKELQGKAERWYKTVSLTYIFSWVFFLLGLVVLTNSI